MRYLYQPNSGVFIARNLGVEKASCDWIAFLDSDDCWSPGHLKRTVSGEASRPSGSRLRILKLYQVLASG